MSNHSSYSIFPLGDSALTIDFGNVIDPEVNHMVLRLFYQLKKLAIKGIVDLVPAYSSLTIHYNPLIILQEIKNCETVYEFLLRHLDNTLLKTGAEEFLQFSKIIKIPVCYAAKYAWDINEIVQQKKVSVEDIIRLHTSKKYRVYMIGFLPGFAYMGDVVEQIAVPRKAQPRINVEPGCVGIAGKQTGIYPLVSPGGWQIIGRTPLQLFNKKSDNPILFQPGDEVEFFSISEDEFENYQSRNS